MTTRAKFRVSGINFARVSIVNPELEGTTYDEQTAEAKEKGIELYIPFDQPTVILNPVMASDENPENSRFWKASPSGEIRLSINNPAGAEVFELGKEYYVDFTPAPEPAEA